MLDHAEPYLLAPSSLTATALRERALALLAEQPRDCDLPEGGARPLRDNLLYDAWLVRLRPGAAGDLHAHEHGYGAVVVVAGALLEAVATADGIDERLHTAGGTISTAPGDTHRLSVAGDVETVAIYLASPPRGTAPRIVSAV